MMLLSKGPINVYPCSGNGEAMTSRMSDERLAWLAVRDRLSRKARRGTGLARLLGFDFRSDRIGGSDRPVEVHGRVNETIGGRMGDYALAVDTVTGRLSADERRQLRETGQVPEWFLGQVEEEVAALRRQRR